MTQLLELLYNSDEGEYKKNSRFEKIKSEEGDFHKVGDQGVILGSLIVKEEDMDDELYLVKFDNDPKHNTIIIKQKIKLI